MRDVIDWGRGLGVGEVLSASIKGLVGLVWTGGMVYID